MVTKEYLHAEIDTLPEEDIARVYAFILQIKRMQPSPQATLLPRLQQIHIQAPHDFAAQHDYYASGCSHDTSDVH